VNTINPWVRLVNPSEPRWNPMGDPLGGTINLWECHGSPIGASRSHGSRVGDPQGQQTRGSPMGVPWVTNHGRPMGVRWEAHDRRVGDQWEKWDYSSASRSRRFLGRLPFEPSYGMTTSAVVVLGCSARRVC